MKKKSIINVGIVGLGRSGWDIHAASLRDNSYYKIVAVCDINIQRIKQAETELGCKGYSSYSSFLQHPGMDLVVIASPTKEHFYMAKEALQKKLHIILEKPPVSTVNEALVLDRLSKDMDVVLSPFYNFRFSQDYVLIRSIIEKGYIGSPYLIRHQVAYFNRRDDWQSLLSEEGGIINAATIHHIDKILQLLGQSPVEIWCDIRRLVSKGDAPDHSKIIMRFPNNCVADVEVSWVAAIPGCEWLIYGPRGAIRQYRDTLEVKWFDENDVVPAKAGERSYFSGEQIKWRKESYTIEEGYKSGVTPEFYNRLAKAILGNGSLPVTLESAIDTMKIIEKCLKKVEV